MIRVLPAKLDRAYCLRLLAEMVSTDSAVGREGELVEYLHRELVGLGCWPQEAEPGWLSVYARLQGARPGRRLDFSGHTDTVPVCEGWETDPFAVVTKDGAATKSRRMHGLGACDMKAGIACILTMLRAFVESGYPFQGELYFSGVIDEEGHSRGARAMLATDLAGCDAIVLAAPYSGDEGMPIPLVRLTISWRLVQFSKLDQSAPGAKRAQT